MTMTNTMNNMNYNLKARNNTNNSLLGEIQIGILNNYFNSGNVSEEVLSELETNLVGNSEIFGEDKEMYASVNAVYGHFAALKENYLMNTASMNKSR